MANNNWSGLTPENDKIWDELWDKYVPSVGIAETIGGEILRAMARIIYRYYNDGDMVGVGYGNETCNSSDRYLNNNVPDYVSLDMYHSGQDRQYEEHMLKNHRIVFNFLQQYPELFEEENREDSRMPSDEDYERERRDEGYDDGEKLPWWEQE